MNRGIQGSAEHGHKWFQHVGSSGRAFHKVLEKITEASPALGTALKFAINPIVGTLALATLAFTYFHDKLKETNAEFDKMGDEAAKPIFNLAEAMKKARKDLASFNEEFQKWVHANAEHQDPTTVALAEQLNLLHLQTAAVEKLSGKSQERVKLEAEFALQAEASRKISEQRVAAGGEVDNWARVNQTKLGNRKIESAEANIKEAKKRQEEKEEENRKILKEIEAIQPSVIERMGGMKDERSAGKRAELESKYSENSLRISGYMNLIGENEKALEDETAARKAVADKLRQAQVKADSLKSIQQTLSHSLESTRQQLSVLATDPTAPIQGNAYTRSTDLWMQRSQGNLDAWNTNFQNNTTAFANRPHMGPIAPRQLTAAEQMQKVEEHLKELRRLATGPGVAIIPRNGD